MTGTKTTAIRLAENSAAYIDANGWTRGILSGTRARCMMMTIREVIIAEAGSLTNAVKEIYQAPVEILIQELDQLIFPLEPCMKVRCFSTQDRVIHWNDYHCDRGPNAADLFRTVAKKLSE